VKNDELPPFLVGIVEKSEYKRWLDKRVRAHVRAHYKRFKGTKDPNRKKCREDIHKAVKDSLGKDDYTKEQLKWTLLNEPGRQPLKPTVDHNWEKGTCKFKICSFKTNDAKSDLSYGDFVELCRKIIKVADKQL